MQEKSSYEAAMRRQTPEPVAIAIARDPQGRDNPITLSWFMTASREPPMMVIAIGRERHSLEAIRLAGEFVLAIPSAAMARDTLYHGTHSGRDGDKLAACGTRTQPAETVQTALLADAVLNYECRVRGEAVSGDHILFIGEVVAAHVNADPSTGRLFLLPGERMGGVKPD